MIYYIIDFDGELVSTLTASEDSALAANLRSGQQTCPVAPPGTPAWWDAATNTWVVKPDKTSSFEQWDRTAKQWVDPRSATQVLDHACKAVRSKRTSLLSATDWSQGKDVADVTSIKWSGYRQALRDITLQPGFPTLVVWPTSP